MRGVEEPALDYPHNLEAERAVLGALMISPELWPEAAKVVAPEHFWREAHRAIHSAIGAIVRRDETLDPITLAEELRRAGKLDEAGGPAYLCALVDGVPRAMNVGQYAEIVRTDALARDVIRTCEQTIKDVRRDPSAIGNGLPTRHAEQFARITSDAKRNKGGDGLPAEDLTDAVDVAREGQAIELQGIRYLVDGLIPFYGMLGFIIAFAKVGKTTWSRALAMAVAMGLPFLDRATQRARVLVLAPEDPSEYTAYTSRHMADMVEPSWMTFYRKPLILDATGLSRITTTVKQGGYGLVLIASWQAVIRGLVKDENDNAGAAKVVEDVKAAVRATGIPWLIDAHSGKGEDQDDDADPSRAMRGASAAAGAADYSLHLRYADGAFGTQRKLSGKGRFVSFSPILMDFDATTSTYTVLGSTKDVASESAWRQIREMGALTADGKTAKQIAIDAGFVGADQKVTNTHRRRVEAAVRSRPDVGIEQKILRGQKVTLYKLLSEEIR